MTPLAQILESGVHDDAGTLVRIPGDWMQGRTAYGGLSSALALDAAQRIATDLPPLRSAQIAFVGPLADEVRVTATMLRRGRNAAFIQADVTGEAGLGLRATFVFMSALRSGVAFDSAPRAPCTRPTRDAKLYAGPDDFFTGNFEFLDQGSACAPAEWLRWARLREREGIDPHVALLAIGDALPPAAFRLFDKPVPLSSLTWIANFLDPAPVTEDGWWLLQARTDRAIDGYSSQRMTVWNADGAPVIEAMQGVAVFG